MAHLVAVTGASGFVGCELVKQLLEKGYRVRATVRDAKHSEKTEALNNLATALPGSLEIVEADLMRPNSFDEIFKGCRYIFHTASPFFIEATDPQAELVDTAVQGTCNVMLAAATSLPFGLRRVILTSSCAAIKGSKNPDPPKNGTLYTEEDWNETSTVEGGEAYWLGKVQAEKAAWALAKEHSIDLVTILPEFIMGPVLSPRSDGTSLGYMRQWMQGKALSGAPVFADVRDVARAHILAGELPSAQGRYIVAAAGATPSHHISSWLKERFPTYQFDDVENEEESKPIVENARAREHLGLAFTPVKETIIDMAVTMIALGLASPKRLH